ncbi:RNA-binding protein [Brevibacillus sp. SYSU BS000544]|uniref:YlmH family RNA-binding protein n=1 Tax=Brevibacillus sp. SYSU BS000544 TaxID=3416443 RepID=UPI003CE52918
MSLFDHFRKEELPFVERALEMLSLVERKMSSRLTDFMDPRQLSIMQSLSSQVDDVLIHADGGYIGAERKRVLIHPPYIEPVQEDYQLVLVEIKGDQRFIKLEHRDILGAVLGIGVKREKFGDIILDEQGCQLILAREIFDFARLQITQIHRIPVYLEEVEWSKIRFSEQNLVEKQITVPSLRLDAVIGEIYHLSRNKALIPIRAGKTKVNWKVVDDPSHMVQTGDVISVGGQGRCKILETSGPTRSGRLRVTVGLVT